MRSCSRYQEGREQQVVRVVSGRDCQPPGRPPRAPGWLAIPTGDHTHDLLLSTLLVARTRPHRSPMRVARRTRPNPPTWFVPCSVVRPVFALLALHAAVHPERPPPSREPERPDETARVEP